MRCLWQWQVFQSCFHIFRQRYITRNLSLVWRKVFKYNGCNIFKRRQWWTQNCKNCKIVEIPICTVRTTNDVTKGIPQKDLNMYYVWGMMEVSLGLLSAYFCCYIENYEGFLWASLTFLSVFIKYIQLTLKIFLN